MFYNLKNLYKKNLNLMSLETIDMLVYKVSIQVETDKWHLRFKLIK